MEPKEKPTEDDHGDQTGGTGSRPESVRQPVLSGGCAAAIPDGSIQVGESSIVVRGAGRQTASFLEHGGAVVHEGLQPHLHVWKELAH